LLSGTRAGSIILLELAFATKSIRLLCERQSRAERELGMKAAQGLRRRLADLVAANSFSDLVAGKPQPVEGDQHMRMAVNLGGGFRMIVTANHNVIPALKNGEVDWSKVRRIQILQIEATHV
jgi:hypothetical protein